MDQPEWNNYLKQFESLTASDFQDIPHKSETSKFCTIMEFRSDPQLIMVIKNFMYLLKSKGWGLIIFHGLNNEDFLKKELCGWKSVYYVRMTVENITTETYSDIFCYIRIWDTLLELGCETALFFQMDTVLLKDSIDDFIEFDYVGAPWSEQWFEILNIGNGGLSLRKVRTMKYIVENYPRFTDTPIGYCKLENEDVYFCYWLLKECEKNTDIKMPSIEIAKKFSVEMIYSEDTCGMHKPYLEKFPNRESFVKLLEHRFL